MGKVITGVEPRWLLSGEGPRCREPPDAAPGQPEPSPRAVGPGLAEALGRLARGRLRVTWEFEDDGGA